MILGTFMLIGIAFLAGWAAGYWQTRRRIAELATWYRFRGDKDASYAAEDILRHLGGW